MESKSAALVAAVFVDFPKNKCNIFCQKTVKQIKKMQLGPIPHRAAPYEPMRSFSPGVVATVALWKSAPMVTGNLLTTWSQNGMLYNAPKFSCTALQERSYSNPFASLQQRR